VQTLQATVPVVEVQGGYDEWGSGCSSRWSAGGANAESRSQLNVKQADGLDVKKLNEPGGRASRNESLPVCPDVQVYSSMSKSVLPRLL
jgi:hypothetical protein